MGNRQTDFDRLCREIEQYHRERNVQYVAAHQLAARVDGWTGQKVGAIIRANHDDLPLERWTAKYTTRGKYKILTDQLDD